MFKKLFGVMLVTFFFLTTNAATETTNPHAAPKNQSLAKLYKFKVNAANEIEYWWVLHNDGCFRLYRVEIVGGILEFWTPLGWWNYIGTTTNCVYSLEQMDTMC